MKRDNACAHRGLTALLFWSFLAFCCAGCAGGGGSGTGSGSGGATSAPSTPQQAITPLEITTDSALNVVTGLPFSVTLQASGGTGSGRTWTLDSGALPQGVLLNSSTGTLSGLVPAGLSSSGSFRIRVSDPAITKTKSFNYLISDGITIGANFPSSELRVGVAYDLPFVAGTLFTNVFQQTTGPIAWRISDGQLPLGLQFQSTGAQTSKIFGVPTAEGVFSVTVEARDQFPQTAKLTNIFNVTNQVTITTNSTSEGRTGRPYATSFSAMSGALPYQWSAINLPAGLNLNASTGQLTGAPFAASIYQFQIAVSDSSVPPASESRFFEIRVSDPLQLSDTMPKVSPNQPYCETVPWSGGGPNRSLQLLSGSLPSGLNFSSGDSVCGTTTQIGDFPLTFRVQEATPVPDAITKTIVLRVDNAVFLVKPEERDAWQDQSFSYFLAAGNGVAPYQWSATGLPSGLTLNATTGEISGATTSGDGFYKYSATVTDSATPAHSDTRVGTIRVRERLQFTGVPRPVPLGNPTNQGIAIPVTGGDGNYTWSIVSGTLPPGMFLAQFGNFPLGGAPSQVGSYPIRMRVHDNSPGPYVIEGDFTITIIPLSFSVNTVQPLAPFATRGAPYHSQIGSAVNGVPSYVWSTSAGQMPPGLALNSATSEIDGIPTQVGRFAFQTLVRDSDTPAHAISQWQVITVRSSLGRNDSIQTATPARNFGMDASISPYVDPNTSLPNPDQDYYRIMAPGGTAIRVYVVVRSFLDSVLELLDANGQRMRLCGAPAYTFACLSMDLSGGFASEAGLDIAVPGPAGVSATFYARVLDWRGDARPDMSYTFAVRGAIDPLAIGQTTLAPGGIRSKNYKKLLTTTGGTGSVSWSLASGALPPGWSIGGTGALGGIATSTGTYTFTIRATDSGTPQQVAQRDFTIQIAEPLTITSAPVLPTVCLGASYSLPIDFTGGHAPYFMQGSVLGVDGSMRAYFSGFAGLLGTLTSTVTLRDSGDPENTDSRQIKLSVVNCP